MTTIEEAAEEFVDQYGEEAVEVLRAMYPRPPQPD